jgi:hypothetical protein
MLITKLIKKLKLKNFKSKIKMPNNFNFIHDINEIKQFYDLFYKDSFKDDIVYMIHLACRKKYLDEINYNYTKETFGYNVGEVTKMTTNSINKFFNRTIINHDSYDKFLSLLYSYNSDKRSLNLPQEGLVLYASLNPRSTFKALTEFNKKMSEWTYDTILNKKMSDSIKNTSSLIKTCIQNSSYEQRYIQLDLDKKEQEYVDILEKFLNDNLINVHCIIETKNGYHYILDSKKLTSEQKKNIFNGTLKTLKFETLNRINETVTKNLIDINSNNPMSPIPGTYQGGYPVKFVKKLNDLIKHNYVIIKNIFKIGGIGIIYEIYSPCEFTINTGDTFTNGLEIKNIEHGNYDITYNSFYFTENQNTCYVKFTKTPNSLKIDSKLQLQKNE